MKSCLALLSLMALSMAGCARNGVDRSYAGSSGSTYDAAANPAQALGAVTYDPASTLAPHDYGDSGQPAR